MPASPPRSSGWSRRSSRAATSPASPRRQCDRSMAWLAAGPDLRQCAPAAGFHPQSRPLIPLSAVWAGPERDEHFDAPPLLFGKTEGSTPFRLLSPCRRCRPHADRRPDRRRQVGAAGVDGAAVPALCAIASLRLRLRRVHPRGRARHARRLARSRRHASRRSDDADEPIVPRAGTATDANMVSLQPLASIHYTPERAWAADWIVDILSREGVAVIPEVKEHLWSALTSLASAPVDERTLTARRAAAIHETEQALQPYCIGDPHGRLLDAETERLGEASVQAFETEGLIGTGAAGRRPRRSLPPH